MRSAAWVAITIGVVAAIGSAACRLLSVSVHPREMMVAGIGMLIVGSMASLPMTLTRGANQLSVVQGGLLASAIHLLGSVLVASSVFLRGVIATYPLLIWVAAFYWTTLITLTISIAQRVRKAPAAANHRAANHG
jgi:hypothetical protein